MRKELLNFLREIVSVETSEIEDNLESQDFLKELAFLTDMTKYLNDLNLKLQGKNKLISDLMSNVNDFRNKLKLFLSNIDNNDLTYFKHCREVVDEFPDDLIDFSMFKTNIKEIMDEFDRRFVDFDRMKDSIVLYTNPMNSVIEQQESKYQMELCDLQGPSRHCIPNPKRSRPRIL